MGGRGASKGGTINGYDAQRFFDPGRKMSEQVSDFENALKAELGEPEFNRVKEVFRDWTVFGEDKSELERRMEPLTKELKSVQVTSGKLWRGGTFTPEYVAALKVGQTINMGGTASWSAKEQTAHMYAQEREATGNRTERVIFVNTSNRHSNSIVNPYVYPQDEVIASRSVNYRIQRIVSKDQYRKTGGYYDQPVTFVYVKEL